MPNSGLIWTLMTMLDLDLAVTLHVVHKVYVRERLTHVNASMVVYMCDKNDFTVRNAIYGPNVP